MAAAHEHDGSLIPASASLKRALSVAGYGLLMSTLFRPTTPAAAMRARFESMSARSRERLTQQTPGLSFADHWTGQLAMESACTVARPRCAVVHLHGGGYVMGSVNSYRSRAVDLSQRFEAEVFVPEYRLAPEHPYPAARDDGLAAIRWVRARRPELPLIVTGDSAGAGLAVSVMLGLRDAGEPMPRAAVLFSPWVDLSLTETKAPESLLVWPRREHLEMCARSYAGTTDRRAPGLSPLYGDLAALPELLVVAGENEVLLADARRLTERARRAGTPAQLMLGEDMQHNWPLALPWLDESAWAWALITRFVAERTELARPVPRACGLER